MWQGSVPQEMLKNGSYIDDYFEKDESTKNWIFKDVSLIHFFIKLKLEN